ncbi:hypothetical protein DFH11DRAFT_1843049 [Phellopilus nigrolimitatus]|nr:hypothetical protein DFH11DRAFT_1843049 [Phellopilus nigrolimitatus]
MKAKAKLPTKTAEDESELATSFDLIAATAFHGHQTLKPKVSFANASSGTKSGGTNSTGVNTTSNASQGGLGTGTSRGHARKESWNNSANAAGLCAFNKDMSPVDERAMALDNALDAREDRREAGRDGVVLVAPHAASQLSIPRPQAAAASSSPVPSDRSGDSTSHSGVGIALSTPTALLENPEQLFSFADHPDAPRVSDYADHTLDDSALNDVNTRRRVPETASHSHTHKPSLPHPYAVAKPLSRPTLQLPSPASMFAQVGTGKVREVQPDEFHRANRNSDALGVEEALSVAFSRGSMDDDQVDKQIENDEDADFGRTDAQILIIPPAGRSTAYYKSTMPQIDEVSGHDSWRNSQDEDSNANLSAPQHPTSMSVFASGSNSSQAPVSLDSSPMTSPRQFKKFDDMEDYSDLFYRPGQQTAGSSSRHIPPSELARAANSREVSNGANRRIPASLSRSDSGSALTNLHRQLSLQYSSHVDDGRHILGRDEELSRHNGSLMNIEEDFDDSHAILSQGSSPGATLPLRIPTSRPLSSNDPSHLIPEDVESSRASSILERFENEDGTEIIYRVGEVPALATPDPVTMSHAQRTSAHGSYFGDLPRSPDRGLRPGSHDNRGRHPSRTSLAPPTSSAADTRASYMTSTSSASRISQLSDFPAPPSQNTMTPGAIIQSYFGNTPEDPDRADPLEEPEPTGRQDRQSRRTTFGPVELGFHAYVLHIVITIANMTENTENE